MSESNVPEGLDPELIKELRQTAETLGRLGQTLAGISFGMLSPRQRNTVERLSSELRRAGELIPRTVTVLLEDRSPEERPTRHREDLGSRLRRLEQATPSHSEEPAMEQGKPPTDAELTEEQFDPQVRTEKAEGDIEEGFEQATQPDALAEDQPGGATPSIALDEEGAELTEDQFDPQVRTEKADGDIEEAFEQERLDD